MRCYSLRVDDLEVQVTRKRMKTIRLRVCAPGGELRLSAPRGLSDEVLKEFVHSKREWICQHRQKIRDRPPELQWQPLDQATAKRYHAHLLQQVPPLIAHYEKALKVSAGALTLRHMKTRWGTCNTRSRRITLNLELAKYSPRALEYVVAHELAHLRVAGHSKRFYALLDEVLPGWREYRKELSASRIL